MEAAGFGGGGGGGEKKGRNEAGGRDMSGTKVGWLPSCREMFHS